MLALVAGSTARNDVFDGVGTATRYRNEVVNYGFPINRFFAPVTAARVGFDLADPFLSGVGASLSKTGLPRFPVPLACFGVPCPPFTAPLFSLFRIGRTLPTYFFRLTLFEFRQMLTCLLRGASASTGAGLTHIGKPVKSSRVLVKELRCGRKILFAQLAVAKRSVH